MKPIQTRSWAKLGLTFSRQALQTAKLRLALALEYVLAADQPGTCGAFSSFEPLPPSRRCLLIPANLPSRLAPESFATDVSPDDAPGSTAERVTVLVPDPVHVRASQLALRPSGGPPRLVQTTQKRKKPRLVQ